MSTNDGGAAFPCTNQFGGGAEGMSLRDYFAAHAIIAAAQWEELSPCGDKDEPSYRGVAARAYLLADAMLAEREKSR